MSTTENRCNRLILRDLMSKHGLTRDKVAELAEVSPAAVDLWLHSVNPTPIHNSYLALIRSKLEK